MIQPAPDSPNQEKQGFTSNPPEGVKFVQNMDPKNGTIEPPLVAQQFKDP